MITTLREFISEHKEVEEYSTNIEGTRFKLLKNSKVVGSTMFSRIIKNHKFNNDPHITLWGFSIREEYRGRGYSKILMGKVLEYLSEMVGIIDLQVMTTMYQRLIYIKVLDLKPTIRQVMFYI